MLRELALNINNWLVKHGQIQHLSNWNKNVTAINPFSWDSKTILNAKNSDI